MDVFVRGKLTDWKFELLVTRFEGKINKLLLHDFQVVSNLKLMSFWHLFIRVKTYLNFSTMYIIILNSMNFAH